MALRSCLLCVLVIWRVDAGQGMGTVHSYWKRLPNDYVKQKWSASSVAAPDLVRCSLTCFKKANCRRFCYDARDKRCYVTGVVMSKSKLSSPSRSSLFFYAYGRCPPEAQDKGYTMVWGKCLKLVKSRRSYIEARTLCAAHGAHMYYLKSVSVDLPILFYVRYINKLKNTDMIWMGATDTAAEGRWKWNDGTAVKMSSPIWFHAWHEPNGGSGENCMACSNRYSCSDRGCRLKLYSLCEIDV